MGKSKVLVKVHPEGKYVVDIDKEIDIAELTPGEQGERRTRKEGGRRMSVQQFLLLLLLTVAVLAASSCCQHG